MQAIFCLLDLLKRQSVRVLQIQPFRMEINMSMEQINPQEAYRILEVDTETLYLDVRTVPEYVAGHPKSALNVPVVIPNLATGQ